MTDSTNLRGDVRLAETEEGNIIFNVPFPSELTLASLELLKTMSPIILKQPYNIDYVHSYGQDSPWFAAVSNKKLLGSECTECGYRYANPRGDCMYDGAKTRWFEMPLDGKIHTWTRCYFGSQEFLKETPYNLALVEFEDVDTLFLSRLLLPGGIEEKIEEAMKRGEPLERYINIGTPVQAKFKRNSKFLVTDVYFVPG